MTTDEAEFRARVGAVLARFFAQHGRAALTAAELDGVVARLQAGVAAPEGDALLATAEEQLAKACGRPDFPQCRDSYRELSPDGACRRQELARTRGRVSGAHCVDCPHWTALAPAAHRELLAAGWRPGHAEELALNWEIFLPEDFRALRGFLRRRAAARADGVKACQVGFST